jgi:hypothetical protein
MIMSDVYSVLPKRTILPLKEKHGSKMIKHLPGQFSKCFHKPHNNAVKGSKSDGISSTLQMYKLKLRSF